MKATALGYAIEALTLAVYLYALLDCVRTPRERVRGRKLLWMLFLLMAPPLSSLAWIAWAKRPKTAVQY
jgi:hypothetical protein